MEPEIFCYEERYHHRREKFDIKYPKPNNGATQVFYQSPMYKRPHKYMEEYYQTKEGLTETAKGTIAEIAENLRGILKRDQKYKQR